MKSINFNKNLSSCKVGKSTWQSPSNIALVKYWGKFGNQLPCNPSISLTLSQATSVTTLEWEYNVNRQKCDVSFMFMGQENAEFCQKVQFTLDKLSLEVPLLSAFKLKFASTNNFPHSAGIASSASGMSALVLTLLSALKEFSDELGDDAFFFQWASHLSRIASGSASRSIYGPVASWGAADGLSSSQLYAAPIVTSKIFSTFHDAIVIISAQKKSVSSSAGHALMNNHPYAQQRFKVASQRIGELLLLMQQEDLLEFCNVVEREALDLHGLMMTSNPSFILLSAGTLKVIERVRQFRQQTQIPLCFTLDAGPNVHLLYPDGEKERIEEFIKQEIKTLVECRNIIYDKVGNGPQQLR